MDRIDVYAPITKREKDPATGHLFVYGKITGPDLDRDQQRMDAEWLKTAVPDWFKTGNIREMHQLKAVGKAVQLEEKDDGWYVGARIVDPVAVSKVEAGVLNGFSIGVMQPQVIKRADAPNGAVTGGRIGETSLVDSPCNATCLLTMAKADGAGELQPVEEPELIEKVDPEEIAEKAETPDIEKAATLTREEVAQMISAAIAAYAKQDARQDAAEMANRKADEPDVTKADDAEPVDAPEYLVKADLADITKSITDAMTKALEPLEQRLAKVEAQPTNGGPVITATAAAATSTVATQKAVYLRKADEYQAAGNLTLAAGYRQMADALKEN